MIDMTNISGFSLTQTTLGQSGLNGTTSIETVSAASETNAADQYITSERSLFISEYEKLNSTEQQEVLDYLNEVSAVKNAGGDASDITTEMPVFIAAMISMGVGDECGSLSTGYTGRTETSAKVGTGENDAQLVSGRGVQEIEEEDDDSPTAPEAEISSGEIKVLMNTLGVDDAANDAPAELQELARETGKDLNSILDKYIDAGASEQVAYAQALSELRAQAAIMKNDDSKSEQKSEE